MTNKTSLVFLLGIIFIAGCTSMEIENLLRTSPEINSFLSQYPNAKITTNLVPQGIIISQLDEIKKSCDNPDFPLASYYKTTLNDEASRTKLTIWVDTKNYQIICAVKQAAEVKTSLGINQSETSSTTTEVLKSSSTTSYSTLRNLSRVSVEEPLFDKLEGSNETMLQISLTNSKKNAENISDWEGSLTVFHGDSFGNRNVSSVTRYYLTTSDKKKIHVYPVNDLRDSLESGTVVKVRGLLLDNQIVFDGNRSLPMRISETGFDVIKQPTNPPALGEQKTLVVVANFKNTQQPQLATDDVRKIVFNDANNYYKENSYGKLFLSGDVVGWYSLNIDENCDITSNGEISTETKKIIEAADNDVDFKKYSRLVLVAPFVNCYFIGYSTIGKIPVETNDGTVFLSIVWITPNSFVRGSFLEIAHELGHSFGNLHAGILDCPNAPVEDKGCSRVDNKDPYDIMGAYIIPGHFNAPHKDHVGWFDPSNIRTASSDGAFTIEPIETASSGIKTLKIPRYTSGEEYLYVEYRQPIGFDSKIGSSGSPQFNGVLLHIGPTQHPYLINASKGGASSNAVNVLGIGQTFTDYTGIKIKTGSIDAKGANVSVKFPCNLGFFRDADGDSYGNLTLNVTGCAAPAGYVTNNNDCNDFNPKINPNEEEICKDNIDQNCNGLWDDNPSNGACRAKCSGTPNKKCSEYSDITSCTNNGLCNWNATCGGTIQCERIADKNKCLNFGCGWSD